MSNIVDLGGQPVSAPEKTYDYAFTFKDGTTVTEHGFLSFNPVFAGTVTAEGKILFAAPMENILSIKRIDG